MRTNGRTARKGYTYLGTAPLRRSRGGDSPTVDLAELRYDPLFGDDDLGDGDVFRDGDGASLGDEYGDDDLGDVDADVDADVDGAPSRNDDAADFGRRLTPQERKQMRLQRQGVLRRQKAERKRVRQQQIAQRRAIRRQNVNSGPTGVRWAKTALTTQGGSGQSVGAGATLTYTVALSLRPQFNFKASDLTLTGAAVGATVGTNLTLDAAGLLNLNFGDQQVWSNAVAVPLAVLTSASFLRNLVRSQRIKGGLDISATLQLTVTSADAGAQNVTSDWTMTAIGFKETRGYCN